MVRTKLPARQAGKPSPPQKSGKTIEPDHSDGSDAGGDLCMGTEYSNTHHDYNSEAEGGLRAQDETREVEYEFETPVTENTDLLPEVAGMDNLLGPEALGRLAETDAVSPERLVNRDVEPISSDLEQNTRHFLAHQRLGTNIGAEEHENIFVDHTGTLDLSFPPRSTSQGGLMEDDGENGGVESSDSGVDLQPSKKRKKQKAREARCHICWKAFDTKTGLFSHMTAHVKRNPHSCRLCIKPTKFNFQTVGKLLDHLKMKHPECEPTLEQLKDSNEIAQRKKLMVRPDGELRKASGSSTDSSTDSDYNQESEEDEEEADISFSSTTTEEERPSKRPAASFSKSNERGLVRGERSSLSGNQKRSPNATTSPKAGITVRPDPGNKSVRASLNLLTTEIAGPKAKFDEQTRDKQMALERIAVVSAQARGKAPRDREKQAAAQKKRKSDDLADDDAAVINAFAIQKKSRTEGHDDAGFLADFSIQKKSEFQMSKPGRPQADNGLSLGGNSAVGSAGSPSSRKALRDKASRPEVNASPKPDTPVQSQSRIGRFFCALCPKFSSNIRNEVVIHIHGVHSVDVTLIDQNVGDTGGGTGRNANSARASGTARGSNMDSRPESNQQPQLTTGQGRTDSRANNQGSSRRVLSQPRYQVGHHRSHAPFSRERAPRIDVDLRGHGEQVAFYERKNRAPKGMHPAGGSGSHRYAGQSSGVQRLNRSNSNERLTKIGMENRLRAQSAYDGYRGPAAVDDSIRALPSEQNSRDFDVDRELEVEQMRREAVARVEKEAEEARKRLDETERTRGQRRLFADWATNPVSASGPLQIPPPPAVPPPLMNYPRNGVDRSRPNLHGLQLPNPYSSGLNATQRSPAVDSIQQLEHLQQRSFTNHRGGGDPSDSDKSDESSSSESNRDFARDSDNESLSMKITGDSDEEPAGPFIHTGIHSQMLAKMNAEDAARAAATAATSPPMENDQLASSAISGSSNSPPSQWDGLGLPDRIKTILNSGDYSALDSGMGLSKSFFEQPAILKKMRQSVFMFFTYVSDSEPESYETEGSDIDDDDEEDAGGRETGLNGGASNQSTGPTLLQPKPQRPQDSAEKVAQWIGGAHWPGASSAAPHSAPSSLILPVTGSSANAVTLGGSVSILSPMPETVDMRGGPNPIQGSTFASPRAFTPVDDPSLPDFVLDEIGEDAVPARPPSPYQQHPKGGEKVRPPGIVEFECLLNPTARLNERELYVYHQTKDFELKKVKKLRATDSTIREYYDEKEQWAKAAFLKTYDDKAKLLNDMDEFRKIHELGIEQTWLRELIVAEVRESYLRGKVDERELLPFWGDCHILGELLVDFFIKNNNRGCVNTMELIDKLGFAGNDLKAKSSDLMKTICYVRNQMKNSERNGLNRKTSFQNVIDKINSFGKKWSACFNEFESTQAPGRSHRDAVLEKLNVVVIKDEKSDYHPRNAADLKSILRRRVPESTPLPAGPGARELLEARSADPNPPLQRSVVIGARKARISLAGPVSIMVIPREGLGLSGAEAVKNPPARQPQRAEVLDPAVHGYNTPKDPGILRAITAARIAAEHKAMKVSTEENPLALVYGSPLPGGHKAISEMVGRLDRMNFARKMKGLPSYSDPPDIMINSVQFRQGARDESHTGE